MRVHRLTLALGLVLGLSSLAPAVSAEPATAAPSPAQVAKLPADTPPGTADLPSANKAPAPTRQVEAKQFAQLTYPVPTTASAADLLLAADDYAFYTDWDHYRQYLNQVVSAYPDTKEAGRALALLADEAARTGDQNATAACAAQLAAYSDSEVKAFADLLRVAYPARRAKQYQVAEQAYLAYLTNWRGAPTAGWVALRLGDLYRFSLEDYDQAITVFKNLAVQYGTGPIAEEALLSTAETLNWSDTGRTEEASIYYWQALDVASTPGLQVRALYGLGDMLMVSGELTASEEIFSEIIAAYPTHPSAALAYALRSQVAEQRGDWSQAVADLRAFLKYPSSSVYQQARAHLALAWDAFDNHRLDEGECEFSLALQLAVDSSHTMQFRGEAQAGLAHCAHARGNLAGAMDAFLRAADLEDMSPSKAVYLYQAADLAARLGDSIIYSTIIARMLSEAPNSRLTLELMGPQARPAP